MPREYKLKHDSICVMVCLTHMDSSGLHLMLSDVAAAGIRLQGQPLVPLKHHAVEDAASLEQQCQGSAASSRAQPPTDQASQQHQQLPHQHQQQRHDSIPSQEALAAAAAADDDQPPPHHQQQQQDYLILHQQLPPGTKGQRHIKARARRVAAAAARRALLLEKLATARVQARSKIVRLPLRLSIAGRAKSRRYLTLPVDVEGKPRALLLLTGGCLVDRTELLQ